MALQAAVIARRDATDPAQIETLRRSEHAAVREAFFKAVENGQIPNPDIPVNILLTDRITENARKFQSVFPAGTQHMYAVKANDHADVIKAMFEAGITHFDVASGPEIRIVRKLLGDAVLYYMHPRKSDSDLDTAFECDVKGFVADCREGLEQILDHTYFDPDYHHVIIRIELPDWDAAVHKLTGKYGANREETVELLQRCRDKGIKDIGLSFHVGSQTLKSSAYARAIELAAEYAREAGVQPTMIDVGGGFPSFKQYPGQRSPMPLELYAERITKALRDAGLEDAQLVTEPGRALVADAGFLVTRVIGTDERRNALHINDGIFGTLHDASKRVEFRFPCYAFNEQGMIVGHAAEKTLMGPTCDSDDMLAGLWALPGNVARNDFVMFENLGAYGHVFQTDFNGFVGQVLTLKRL